MTERTLGDRVSAIVVAHDSADVLPACLAALGRTGIATIVVDNASRDSSVALSTELGARVLRLARNEGYGRANNVGILAADTEFALVCNPDAVPAADCVAELVAAADRFRDAGLLAPRIVEASGRFFFQPRSLLAPYLTNPGGRLTLPEGDCCVPFASGACFLIRRHVFLELGGFDPAIFLFYEDDDFCRRVAESGRALVHVHAAIVRHARGASSTPEPGRVFRSRWHQAWSRAYVARKWGLPAPAPTMCGLNAFKTALVALTLQRVQIERYAGSTAGAWAFMRGRSALSREGLDGSGG